jgi:hypothetical protein
MLNTNRVFVYQRLLVLLCSSPNEQKSAFELAERARARMLLEQLSATTFRAPSRVSSQQLTDERELLERLRGLYVALRREAVNLEERTRLVEAVNEVQSDLNALWNQLQSVAPDYVALRQGKPAGYDEIRTWL